MLRHAYFSNFKQGPKLLVWGNAADIREFADFLATTVHKSDGFTSSIPGIAVDDSEVLLVRSGHCDGLQRAANNAFSWCVDRESLSEFIDMVDALAAADGPCHQYLECSVAGEVTVMVSRDEYPDQLHP
jgi:hypothetical protein